MWISDKKISAIIIKHVHFHGQLIRRAFTVKQAYNMGIVVIFIGFPSAGTA